MIFELVKDFAAVLEAMPKEHPHRRILKLLDEAIRRDVYFIERHPTTLFQCLWNACWSYDCPEAAQHYENGEAPGRDPGRPLSRLMERWRRQKEETGPTPWLRSHRPPPLHLGTAQQAVFYGHVDRVTSVAYSPDGRRIVSGSGDKSAWVWDAETGMELACLCGHERAVTSVTYSSDGRRIVSGSVDETARVWDADSGAELTCMRGHKGVVRIVAFSPDGGRIASGGASRDKTVRVWDTDTGAELACMLGHKGDVRSLAFSPDGHRVASEGGYGDKAVWVWDVESGECLEVIHGAGDTAAIAAGAPRIPWRAIKRSQETVIEPTADGPPMAWFPMEIDHITTDATGRTWAGGVANNLYLFTLENTPPVLEEQRD